jgi:hypothetical protein
MKIERIWLHGNWTGTQGSGPDSAKMPLMVRFLSCVYYCKTAGCVGLIVPQYDARRERDSETGRWKLTCPECGVARWYDETEACTDDVPTERLHQLFPERYPN